MKISYEVYEVDFEKMTSDLEMTIQFRNFLLFNRHNAARKGDRLGLGIASLLSKAIGEIHTVWQKYHMANCVGLDSEGLDKNDIVLDYDKSFIVKGDIFAKPAVLDEFIKYLKNWRRYFIDLEGATDFNEEAKLQVIQIYDAMINEIISRKSDLESTPQKEMSPEKSRKNTKKAG